MIIFNISYFMVNVKAILNHLSIVKSGLKSILATFFKIEIAHIYTVSLYYNFLFYLLFMTLFNW